MKEKTKKGKVYLVGAGPGDIGLLTVKGLRCLQKADVVVYDFHLNAQILNYIKKDAEFVYAGKRGGHHEMTQEEINNTIVDKALEGKTVCRLKGGDPFVFGRGGEEAEVLTCADIEFEVVPGISSAVAVPAYAGIPLTHRRYASSFIVLPGNEATTKEESAIDWDALAKQKGTIVFLMAVKNIGLVSERLIKYGKPGDTPVAVIRWGTRADQKTVISTLENVSHIVADHEIKPPAVVVIGDVVRLRKQLNWYERKPLFGQRILITRAYTEEYEPLEALGAEIIEFPTIEVVPPVSYDELDRAISGIEDYDWIVFTSANGVRFFFNRYFELERDIRDLKGIKICAVGPKTALSIKKYGLRVNLVPDAYRAEGLVEAFGGEGGIRGLKILLPRAEVAREVFPEKVRELGGRIDVPVTYRAVRPDRYAKRLQRFLKEGRVTIATFTSGATFVNLCEILKDDVAGLLKDVLIVAIGPVTKKEIEKRGLKVHIMPNKATIADMVDAVIRHFTSGESDHIR